MLWSVYVSAAAQPFNEDDLAQLLTVCRENNAALEVTGLLLYKEGQFMQALEGPDEAVRTLMATIARDPRHKSVWTLFEEEIEKRQFGQWTMGFRAVDDESIRDIPGFDDFFEDGVITEGAWATKSRAHWLLNWFRDHEM